MRAERSYKAKGRSGTRSFAVRTAGVILPGLLLGGCMAELAGSSVPTRISDRELDITGSIVKGPGGIPTGEPSALHEALSPQADGAAVVWFDPLSGLRGTILADGSAFVSDDRLCRRFIAAVEHSGRTDRSVGSACRIGAGAWTVRERRPAGERA
jgi:hypothetical protein